MQIQLNSSRTVWVEWMPRTRYDLIRWLTGKWKGSVSELVVMKKKQLYAIFYEMLEREQHGEVEREVWGT